MYKSKIYSEVFPTSHTRRLEFSVCQYGLCSVYCIAQLPCYMFLGLKYCYLSTTVVFYSFMCLTVVCHVFQRVPRSGLDEEKQGGKSPKYLFNDGKI